MLHTVQYSINVQLRHALLMSGGEDVQLEVSTGLREKVAYCENVRLALCLDIFPRPSLK